MKQRLLKWVSARLVAAVALVLPLAAMAATPYAVWDGASPEFDFSVLTRRGYTLGNLGGSYMNTVAADGSYLQIGNNNAKEGITFKKADGTALPASTIIVKCENITATDNYNRALIAYLSSTAYQGSHAFIGIARSKNGTLTINDETVDTVGAGCFIYQGKVWDNTTYVDGAFAPPETGGKVIALSYGNSAGTAYYVDGVKIDSNSNLKSSGFSPMGIVLGGVDTTGNGMFYPMVGMKITAIAFFGEKLSDSDVAAYKFPSENENVLTMTALNALTAAGEEGTVDKSFTSLVTMSETDEAPTAATKAFLNDSSWNGIVKIGNVTLGEGSLADFGNANSTISVVGNGVTFDQLAADTTFAGTLTGDGDITITAVIDPQKTVRFTGDCSTFAGGITIPQSGKARVAFGTGTTGNNNCLIVSEGCTVTVASGKTWTAPNGFVINGNITVAGNLAGGEKIYGTGVVTVANASARTGMIFAGSWTGIAKIAYNPGNVRFVFNEFGNASSVVEIIGADNAFSALPSTAWAGGTAPSINPAVVLSANWTVSNGWDNATTSFSKLSGAGNLTVNGSSSGVTPIPYDIVSLNGYTGTLGGARGQFAIEKIYLDATPTPGDKLVNLNASKEFKDIDLTEVYVNGVLDSTIDLEVKSDGIYVAESTIDVTVPIVANTVVTVTVGGETVAPATEGGNIYKVAPGSVVTVTYAAADGYEISGTTEYTVDTASATTFEVAADMATAQYVAQIRTGAATYEKYTTLAAALGSASAATAPITLLADVTENDITFASIASISGNNHTINADITIANGGKLQLMLATLNGTLTIQSGGTYVTIGGTLGNVVVQDGGIINLTTLSEDAAPLTVSTLTVNGALTVVSTYGLAERGKTYKAISYVTGNATIAEGASFNGKDEWSASTTVDGDNTVVCLEITKVAVVDGVYYDTAQEAVEAAVASGKQAQFLVQPGTVTLGAGETLVVKGGYQPTVELDAGLSTPPYEVESGYDITTGIYTYAVKRYVAQIGDDKYESIAAAVAVATSGQTVTLLANVALDSTVVVDNSLTFDLNGMTITGPADGYVFSNAGGVTIVGNGTVTGAGGIVTNTASGASVVISNGTYTVTGDLFGNVEGGEIAVSGGTFSAPLDDDYCAEGYEPADLGNGTYGVRIDKGWIYEDKDFPNYTGSWTTQVEYGADNKITLDSDNTYTANKPSDGRFVTLNITASFDDVNDDNSEIAGAKAAVRLAAGDIEGNYVFQLYTTTNNVNGCWVDVLPNGDIDAKTNTNYTFTLVLDMTNRTYTAMVDNSVLGLQGDDSVTNFVFATAAATDVVQTLDFRGSGTVTSITGSYENPEAPAQEFAENQEIGSVTLTARQATWLNGQNNYAELAAKIATMDATAFSNAYLLNLNILSAEYDGTYSFTVTEITFGPYETVEAVTIKVELVRKGALDGGINGRLSLKGGNSLPASGFETISEVLIDDETFEDGNVATIVFEKDDEHAAAFYQPVILPIVE